jgi:hypothetical protein
MAPEQHDHDTAPESAELERELEESRRLASRERDMERSLEEAEIRQQDAETDAAETRARVQRLREAAGEG